MVNGYSADQKTGVYSSGILTPGILSSCSKATRTRVSCFAQAEKAIRHLIEREIKEIFLLTHYDSQLVISVAPSPQGELFATGSGDMRARIWRLAVKPFLICDLFANADMMGRYWPYNPIN